MIGGGDGESKREIWKNLSWTEIETQHFLVTFGGVE